MRTLSIAGLRWAACLIISIALCAIGFGVYIAWRQMDAGYGTLYRPAETLNPKCAPRQLSCGVRPSTGVSAIASLDGLTDPLSTLQGGTGLSGVIPLGTLLFGTGTDTLSQLNIGLDGQVLTVKDGVPAWSTIKRDILPGDAVTSVFSRMGAVIAEDGDYTAAQIANVPTDTIAGTTVQDALNQLGHSKYAAYDNPIFTGLTVATGSDQHEVVAAFGNTVSGTAIYTTNASPEGDIMAAVGALAINSGSGAMFIKTSGSGTTGWTQFGSANGCTATGCTFSSTGTNTIDISGINGGLSVSSNGSGALDLDSGTTGAVNVGTGASSKAITFGNTAGSTSLVLNSGTGGLTLNGKSVVNGTMDISGSTTIGASLTVAGSESLRTLAVANLPTGGNIGTAAATVDIASSFNVTQGTAGQTITLPSPTNTTSGRLAYLTNTGSSAFTFYGLVVPPGQAAHAAWVNNAWRLVGAPTPAAGACITTGCTFTSPSAISVSTTNGALAVTSNGNGTLLLDSGTGVVNIGTGTSVVVSLGTGTTAKAINFGNTTGATSVVINSGSGGLSFNTASNGNISFAPNGTGLAIFGTATNGTTISSGGVINFTGTARPTRHVNLSPEYPGATLTPSGTNNVGTMTSDYCSNGLAINITICPAAGNIHSYYSWTSTSGTAQNYDIYVQYKIPTDFSAFSGTFKTYGWRTTANDSVIVNVYNGSTACGTFTASNTNTVWTQGSVTPTCTAVPGDMLTFKINVSAINLEFARAAEIDFDYLRKF